MRLVVGLGNPGIGFQSSRHNVGYRVVEEIACRRGIVLRSGPLGSMGQGEVGGRPVILLLPGTFMNLSGEAVGEAMARYGVGSGDIVLVHDDLDLPVGKLRIKRNGGDGGHRGVRSVLTAAGTAQVGRVKVGIGRPPAGRDAAGYVLEPFSAAEAEVVETAIRRAADAVECILKAGYEEAMNRFNREGDDQL